MKNIHIPKVTIDEDEFVLLKWSDFVSSGISSEMLGPGDIWGDVKVTVTLVDCIDCIESFSLDPFLDRLTVLPFGPVIGFITIIDFYFGIYELIYNSLLNILL